MSDSTSESQIESQDVSVDNTSNLNDNFVVQDDTGIIREMVSANPSLMNDPEIKSFIESSDKNVNTEASTTSAVDNTTTDSTSKSKKETDDTESTDSGEEQSSIFFNKMKEQEKLNVKTFEDAIKTVNGKYSIDAQKEGGWDTFFNSVDKWRNDSQKVSELNKQIESIKESFDNMPEQLYKAVESWSMGKEDWSNEIQLGTGSKIDFNKDFNSQDLYGLVNYYFPNDFERDDLEDTSDPTIKKAIDLTKRQYEIERENLKVKLANQKKDEEIKVQRFKDSLDSSVDNLRKTFPSFSESHFKHIEKALRGGDINSLFFNNDSTYKSDAAEKLALVLFGKEELLRVRNQSAKESKSKTLEEVVSRSSNKPNITGNQNAVKTGSNTDLEKMFSGLIDKRHY